MITVIVDDVDDGGGGGDVDVDGDNYRVQRVIFSSLSSWAQSPSSQWCFGPKTELMTLWSMATVMEMTKTTDRFSKLFWLLHLEGS